MRLYLVELQGLNNTFSPNTQYGASYVVAETPDEALNKVQKYLNENNIGFINDRKLKSIHLIAESIDSANCIVPLFV